MLYAAIALLILVPASLYFWLAEPGLPEASPISIYKNERGRRRGAVSRSSVLLGAVARDRPAGAVLLPGVIRQNGRARRRLAPGARGGAPARHNVRALPPRRAALRRYQLSTCTATRATRRDLFRDLSERLDGDYYRQPALVDDDDVAPQARRASSRSSTGEWDLEAHRRAGTRARRRRLCSNYRRRRLIPHIVVFDARLAVVCHRRAVSSRRSNGRLTSTPPMRSAAANKGRMNAMKPVCWNWARSVAVALRAPSRAASALSPAQLAARTLHDQRGPSFDRQATASPGSRHHKRG